METPGVDIESLPFSQTPEYRHGISAYKSLQDAVISGRFYHNDTGLPRYEGLTSSRGSLIPLGTIRTQEKYIEGIRDFMQGNSTLYSNSALPAERHVKKDNLPSQDWSSIGIQMSGYGAAALQAGDMRTALLAFEVAGALRNKEVQSALRAAIAKGGHPITSIYLQTMTEIEARKRRTTNIVPEPQTRTSPKLVERPKAPLYPREPITIARSQYQSAEPLVSFDLSHDGGSNIFYVGPKDTATRIVKFPKDFDGYNRLYHEVECLKRAQAKGLTVYPRLTVVMETPAHYVGVEMERIKGKSLRHTHPSELTPEKFGLSNRMWLIYDLIDSYIATGYIHGDLFSIDAYLRNKREKPWPISLEVHLDNLVLEEGTSRLRLIDPLAGPSNQSSHLLAVKGELEGMIEFLFRGRAKKISYGNEVDTALPSIPEIQKVGIKMMDSLQSVTSLEQLYSIIPPEARLPGEKH